MGGSPKAPPPQPVPAAPAPIDYDKMAEASIRVAKAQIAEEEAAIKRLYPEYIGMQFGTADQLAGKLDNQYLGQSKNVLQQELDAASRPSQLEAAITRRSIDQFNQGPTLADRQILGQTLLSMNQRADQVRAPQNIREITASPITGIRADRVANVESMDVGSGALGDSLMNQAIERANSRGQLSAEAQRDATQAARAAMSARGLGVGNAALAAEVLNRDRFTRQRMNEDAAFAQSVQQANLARQFGNQEARMRAAMANQGVSAQQALANQSAAMDAQRLNQAASMQAQMSNQQRDQILGEMSMRAQLANQAANQQQLAQNRDFMITGRDAFNMAEDRRMQLGMAANQLDQARRQRRVGLAGAYQELDPFRQSIGPAFGLGTSTLANTTGQVGNIFGNQLATAGNVESFNRNMAMSDRISARNYNAAIQGAAMQSAATGQAGWMSMLGGGMQGLGAIGGGFAQKSDRRLKKDIKPIGKDPLGLTTYEYRFKGESAKSPKHTGYMAQEVQKVLPEAVTEIPVNGQPRLAIKPAMIGQAIAATLASDQRPMFAKGYTVGSGLAK